MTDRPTAELAALLERRDLLIGRVGEPGGSIAAIAYDSRRVRPGTLFVALVGQHADGHDHARSAAAAGAVALIVERPLDDVPLPQLIVTAGRPALALAAAWHAGFPGRALGIVGITGTDGKTTTAYLVRAILERTGATAGLIGTTDVVVGGVARGNPARTTTPEAPELQAHLAAMVAAGDGWAVIEATSHGLAQHRVDEVPFDVAVLTNVTQEHLEFHGSLEAYRAAKRRLFELLATTPAGRPRVGARHAVINADDPVADGFGAAAEAAGAIVHRYGLGGALATGAVEPASDIVATGLTEDPAGMQVAMSMPGWQGTVDLRLAGRFNVHNALAAMTVGRALGLDPDESARALAGLAAVPGRMERVDAGQPFTVVVDYAHTVASLANVLDELAPAGADAGLIAVFGSAGERDTAKRPEMGRVAAERCRLVVVTDEDPRGEDREAIIEAIAAGAEAAGARRGKDLLLVPDREAAIGEALGRARPGDVVLLAGKGHERTIEMAEGDRPWDEAAVARAALGALGYVGAERLSDP